MPVLLSGQKRAFLSEGLIFFFLLCGIENFVLYLGSFVFLLLCFSVYFSISSFSLIGMSAFSFFISRSSSEIMEINPLFHKPFSSVLCFYFAYGVFYSMSITFIFCVVKFINIFFYCIWILSHI